jgi:hypothetical protein
MIIKITNKATFDTKTTPRIIGKELTTLHYAMLSVLRKVMPSVIAHDLVYCKR